MESLTGNATRFARMMLNANDPKTAAMEKNGKLIKNLNKYMHVETFPHSHFK